MSADRPTVSPDLIAAIIEATPDRVRRRLDKTPDAAGGWQWEAGAEAWSVDTGGETVTLRHGHIVSVDQIRCTCLLSPGCFHILACLTHLQVVIVESAPADQGEQATPVSLDSDEDLVEPSDAQRNTARELANSVSELLRAGVANAGVVVQSGLLRAVHQCRADGLHRLAALGLRVIGGTSEFRSRAATADPEQLSEDVGDILENSRHLLHDRAVNSFWIGTARRKQLPVNPRRLYGLFAEPIITRSGFTGAAVYFLGEDDRFYSASDVRPGDAQHARNAYLGGIEIGSLVQPAKQLARALYLGSEMTASADGRLGRGKAIRIVEHGRSNWQSEAIQRRFRRRPQEQWDAVYSQTALPADARSAGWDFVFLEGTVLGASGSELLFALQSNNVPVRLAIQNESEPLCFRENLRMLSFAPGLRLQMIARVDLRTPRRLYPLAIAAATGDANAEAPRLEIPDSFAGRFCMGFDEIQRTFLPTAGPLAMILDIPAMEHIEDPLIPLRRRWVATMLSGDVARRTGKANLLDAEMAGLKRSGFATGAALLNALSSTSSHSGPGRNDTFLATAVYVHTSSHELARARAFPGN
jgi:hypothetical protein